MVHQPNQQAVQVPQPLNQQASNLHSRGESDRHHLQASIVWYASLYVQQEMARARMTTPHA